MFPPKASVRCCWQLCTAGLSPPANTTLFPGAEHDLERILLSVKCSAERWSPFTLVVAFLVQLLEILRLPAEATSELVYCTVQ